MKLLKKKPKKDETPAAEVEPTPAPADGQDLEHETKPAEDETPPAEAEHTPATGWDANGSETTEAPPAVQAAPAAAVPFLGTKEEARDALGHGLFAQVVVDTLPPAKHDPLTCETCKLSIATLGHGCELT